MTTLLALSTVTVLCYLCLSVKVAGGIPVSLSATYYLLGNRGWLFQAFMVLTAATLFPVWVEHSGNGHEWMAFLACASLLFVASAPCFKLELEGKVHYTSAVVCCVCAVSWQLAEGLWDVTLWCAFIAGMLSLQERDKWCWWLECAVFVSLYMNLYRLI